ncbi:MAG: Signal transduction histidine-protein kinase BaeS [Chloroflexi bacterium]|nr:Signal transduction histidine-protein kinase BaeS [Chloroflexota bacterium]
MRLRLFLSFALVILIAIFSVVLVIGKSMASEVRDFMFRGGALGLEGTVDQLESCYAEYQNWESCSEFLETRNALGGSPWGMRGGMGTNNEREMRGRGMDTEQGRPALSLQIIDTNGNVVADTQNPSPNAQVDDSVLQNAFPLLYQGQEVGYLLPEGFSAFTSQQEETLVSQLNNAALIAAGISGGTALVLAILLAYSLLRPIRKLTKAANLVGEGDLSQRVSISGDAELATLGNVFNQMARSLQQAEERRQSLTADIAHELRTPLSVQQAHLEALQDGIYELSPENLLPITEQNRSLTRLVEDLRTLALADAGELTLEKTKTDFPELVRRIVTRFKPQAQTRGITLDLSLADDVPILDLDPQRIEQILNNLLGNALHYSPEKGVIKIRLTPNPQHVILKIRDNGPGIPPEELRHIFDRFYKSDKSRTRSKGGTGLGLSISQKLAQAHGGKLEAGNHPQGGAVFTLILMLV